MGRPSGTRQFFSLTRRQCSSGVPAAGSPNRGVDALPGRFRSESDNEDRCGRSKPQWLITKPKRAPADLVGQWISAVQQLGRAQEPNV